MKQLAVAVGDTWQPKALPYLAMALMASMLITEVLNLKFVEVFGISVIGSQISFVISLVLADVLTEVYGYRRVRRLLWAGLACLVVYAAFVQVTVELPPAAGYANNDAFRALFSQSPRIVFASLLAYFVTERTNSYIMSRLKVHYHARFFYGRAVMSVGIAQLVDVGVFYGIAFAGVMPLSGILSASMVSWVAVMACELCVLPITKRFARRLKEHEGVEHYDFQPVSM